MLYRCGKIGHFGAVSYQLINSVEWYDPSPEQSDSTHNSSALDSFFLDTVETSQYSKYWTATILVNGLKVSFKLNTGAGVTSITEKSLELLGSTSLITEIFAVLTLNHCL